MEPFALAASANMKKLLTLLLLLPALVFGAAGDIKVDRKNSSDNAWIATIFATANSQFLVTSSSGVPALSGTGLTWTGGDTLTATKIIASTSITNSGLTAGRVTYASTGGLMAGSANFTFTDGTTTGQVVHPVGAVGTPSVTFLGDTDNGLYYIGTNNWGLTAGGTRIASLTSTAISLPSTLTSGFRVNNQVDEATDYERLEILFTGNVATIRSVRGNIGTLRDLVLQSGTGASFTVGQGSTVPFSFNGSSTSNTGLRFLEVGTNLITTATSGTTDVARIFATYNQASGNAVNNVLKLIRVETNLSSGTQNLIDTYAGTLGTTNEWTLNNKGKITQYGAVATAGWGQPAIYAAGRVTAQSAANSSIATYTVGAADGSFEVSANMNVTAVTTLVTTLTCTYTDESNTARTMIFPVTQLSGSFISLGAITTTGAWETPVLHIRCKASTAITILTSAGTFTGVTYTAEGIIKQTN